MIDKAGLLIGAIRPDETDMGREDRAPGRQLAAAAKGRHWFGLQGALDQPGQSGAGRREVGDRRRHPGRRGHHVGPKDRQIKTRVRKPDAMQDLQSSPQPRRFEMQLAQSTGTGQFIANEQSLAIEAAADLFEIVGQRQRRQLRKRLPALANARSQRFHQGMETHRWQDQQNADPAMGLAVPPTAFSSLIPGLEPVQSWTLPTGARVVALPVADAPLVCIDLWCRAGSAFETASESGMAHLLEHMVFKGSEQQPAGLFDLRVEALGGSSNAATGFDDVHYHVLVPPQALGEACDLLLDLVLQPRLDSDDLDMERQVVLEELAQSQDQPDEMALQTLLELGCGSHPYGRPILGERQQLEAHSSDDLRRFQQRLYRAEACVLALSGPLNPEVLQPLLEHLAGSLLGALPPAAHLPVAPSLSLIPGVHRRSFARLEAARLLMAWSLPGAADRTAVAGMDLATSLLAEGRRSRLVERLREQLRLVESIDLDLQVLEFGSLALLEAVCDPDDLPEVRQQVTAVLEQVQLELPMRPEWERGHRLVANGYRFGLEAPAGIAAVIGNVALWQRPSDLSEPLQVLQRLQPADLQRSFALLQPQRACVLEAVPA